MKPREELMVLWASTLVNRQSTLRCRGLASKSVLLTYRWDVSTEFELQS